MIVNAAILALLDKSKISHNYAKKEICNLLSKSGRYVVQVVGIKPQRKCQPNPIFLLFLVNK